MGNFKTQLLQTAQRSGFTWSEKFRCRHTIMRCKSLSYNAVKIIAWSISVDFLHILSGLVLATPASIRLAQLQLAELLSNFHTELLDKGSESSNDEVRSYLENKNKYSTTKPLPLVALAAPPFLLSPSVEHCPDQSFLSSNFENSGRALVNALKHWDCVAVPLSLAELISVSKASPIELSRFCIFEIAELSSSTLNWGVPFRRWSIRTTGTDCKLRN
ncbi:hypothetical protein Tsp_10543 [Trichinella spiralis]|uniref:hypothetical protein n=1 Tax=Trichinella spiralis TaxID=6334 RepID=UPI0001EFD581|nr:hypothetical protein Tsp_10543 [Trichinella spiralis]